MIQRLYIAQCDRCQLYVAPTSSRTPALHDLALSATRAAEQDAVAYAVKRGWCAYPLLCPTCNDLIRGGLRKRHAQAVRRAVERGGFKPTAERPAVVEQPDTPRRGDQVEAWLKQQRDERRDDDHGQWSTLDALLDAYRLHADTSTPLSEHVCEGRVVGDCECLEQPDTQTREA